MAYMETLQEFYDVFFEELQKHIDNGKAETVAKNLTETIKKRLGGCPIYIPMEASISRTQRNRLIFSLFNGRNHHQLARQFNLSTNQIYDIVKKARKLKG